MHSVYVKKLEEADRQIFEDLLERHELTPDAAVDETLVMYHGDRMIGTCSSYGKIIKMFAVNRCYQGGGYARTLLSNMLNRLFDSGYYTVLAYTPSKNRDVFEAMQFRCIYDTQSVALMSIGVKELERSLQALCDKLGSPKGSRGAIVMNGNPFTKGHAYLIEEAKSRCDELIVFVVESEQSSFTTEERLALIRSGTKGMQGVHVLLAGDYIISTTTFPQYFERSLLKRARWSAELDAGIFVQIFSRVLRITKRFVGSEPYCPLTAQYNQALKDMCDGTKVDLIEIERLELEGKAVSASLIRRLIQFEDWEAIRSLVPETTYSYLKSEEALETIQRIQSGHLKGH